MPSIELVDEIKSLGIENILQLNSLDKSARESSIAAFKQALIKLAPEDFIVNVPLAGDLVEAHSHVILITPIDIEAPKGRLSGICLTMTVWLQLSKKTIFAMFLQI